MPPEYCEYGPDFETHCDPWLQKHHPDLYETLAAKRGADSVKKAGASTEAAVKKPPRPWTTEERLTAFYEKYVPEKIESVPALLEKYAGKEDSLFKALVKKYGEEPSDPYYSESSDSEVSEDEDEGKGKKKRRGASAKKKETASQTRVVVAKESQKKKRFLTIVSGMETVPDVKLKDASKTFSKRFAGSSSVKENPQGGKDIIIQGDHMYDVAEFIADKFQVDASSIFLDMDGDIVPLA